jgi:hypothetical protein
MQQAEIISQVIAIIPYAILLLVLLSILFYVQRLLRAKLVQPEQTPTDILLYFKKLEREGKITPQEFRIIEKVVLRLPQDGKD